MRVVNIDALVDPIIELLGVRRHRNRTLARWFIHGPFNHQLETETALSLYLTLAAIADPVRKMSSVFTRLQSGAAAADRIFAFLDRQPRVTRNADGPRLQKAELRSEAGKKGKTNFIEFRDVCFSYEPNCPITAEHQPQGDRSWRNDRHRQANAYWQSTLVGLLPRFYDPLHGSLFINGMDIREVNLRSLRQQIGIVTQESILFDDTLYNNIAYGSRGATQEQVEAAARKAYAHDFIMQKDGGYQNVAGEGGRLLSGGERQRVTLARAIMRDPSILILDEFTSNYDAEVEALINRAMRDFMVGRTSFVITHKLHTLEAVDRIIDNKEKRTIRPALARTPNCLGCTRAYQRVVRSLGTPSRRLSVVALGATPVAACRKALASEEIPRRYRFPLSTASSFPSARSAGVAALSSTRNRRRRSGSVLVVLSSPRRPAICGAAHEHGPRWDAPGTGPRRRLAAAAFVRRPCGVAETAALLLARSLWPRGRAAA